MRGVIIALTALVACVPQEEMPMKKMPPEESCGADKLQHFLGMPYDSRDFEDNDKPLRVLPPGSMMTMDHRTDRLNVNLDEEGIITRIWCG